MKQIRSLARTGMAVLAAALALAAIGCTGGNTDSDDVLEDSGGTETGGGSSSDGSGSTDSSSETSDGGSSGSVSAESGTPGFPAFLGEEIFKGYGEQDYYVFDTATSVSYYYFSSDHYLSKEASYIYNQSNGSLISSKGTLASYLWRINGGYYQMDDDVIPCGGSLFGTHTQSFGDSYQTKTYTMTFSSDGTCSFKKTISDGGTRTFTGTFKNTGGFVTITGTLKVSDPEEGTVKESFGTNEPFCFYYGTSLYIVRDLLTKIDALPSSASGTSTTDSY